MTAVAKFDFEAEADDELSFSKGDEIIMQAKDDDPDEWCFGTHSKTGATGIFPIVSAFPSRSLAQSAVPLDYALYSY